MWSILSPFSFSSPLFSGVKDSIIYFIYMQLIINVLFCAATKLYRVEVLTPARSVDY